MIKYASALETHTLFSQGLEKVADTRRKEFVDQIAKFIETLKPDKDKHIYTLTLAMGASEFYGPNANWDYWPEEELAPVSDSFGHKTFLNAGLFLFHKNKDKSKTLGQVLLALYNPIMRRVELIERFDRDKCELHDLTENVYDRLLAGEFLPRSMGAHIDHDICILKECGNKAKTRAEYCRHAKNMLGEILPDGRRICVINPRPRFFDISIVGVPADKTARTLGTLEEKNGVICLGNICSTKKEEKKEEPKQQTEEKTASLVKVAEEKVVRKINYKGLQIHIETQSGDFRYGYARGGRWKKRMLCHYGFIPKTDGEDGENIDVYVKNPPTDKVFIIKQQKDGKFDEDKVMLGFNSPEEAKSMYLAHIPEKYYGGMVETTFDVFINRYLTNHVKEAQTYLKELCNCNSDCCIEKKAQNKKSDMVKQVPAITQELRNALKKIKLN